MNGRPSVYVPKCLSPAIFRPTETRQADVGDGLIPRLTVPRRGETNLRTRCQRRCPNANTLGGGFRGGALRADCRPVAGRSSTVLGNFIFKSAPAAPSRVKPPIPCFTRKPR